jgi:hypothetical protein
VRLRNRDFRPHGLGGLRPDGLRGPRRPKRSRLTRDRRRRVESGTLRRLRRFARSTQETAKPPRGSGFRRRLRRGGGSCWGRTGRLDLHAGGRRGPRGAVTGRPGRRRVAARPLDFRRRSGAPGDRPLGDRSRGRAGFRPGRCVRRTRVAHDRRPGSRRGPRRLGGIRSVWLRLGDGRLRGRLWRSRRRRRRNGCRAARRDAFQSTPHQARLPRDSGSGGQPSRRGRRLRLWSRRRLSYDGPRRGGSVVRRLPQELHGLRRLRRRHYPARALRPRRRVRLG